MDNWANRWWCRNKSREVLRDEYDDGGVGELRDSLVEKPPNVEDQNKYVTTCESSEIKSK